MFESEQCPAYGSQFKKITRGMRTLDEIKFQLKDAAFTLSPLHAATFDDPRLAGKMQQLVVLCSTINELVAEAAAIEKDLKHGGHE